MTTVCTPHTVQTPGGYVAGLLVRSAGSRKELGYIWAAGSVFRWQTPDGANYGERSTRGAAIDVLIDIYELRAGQQTLPGFDIPVPQAWAPLTQTPRASAPKPKPATPKPAPAPPAEPVRHVVWADGDHDLTSAVGAALRRSLRDR
jgi:hypothetical protein